MGLSKNQTPAGQGRKDKAGPKDSLLCCSPFILLYRNKNLSKINCLKTKLLYAHVTFELAFPLYRSYVYSSLLHLGHPRSFLCASISKESGSSNQRLPLACLSHATSDLMERKLVPLILTLCSVTTWCPVLSKFFLYIAFGKLHIFLQFSIYFVF